MSRRLGAWLALVAMAFNALWPVLAQASPRGFEAEMCAVDSASVVAQPELPGAEFPQAPVKRTAAHCEFCASWAGFPLAAIAVAWSFVFPLPEAAGFHASSSSAGIVAAVLDGAAPPRAPPAS